MAVGEPLCGWLTLGPAGIVTGGDAHAARMLGLAVDEALASRALRDYVGTQAAEQILGTRDGVDVVARRRDGTAVALAAKVYVRADGHRRVELMDLCHTHGESFATVAGDTIRDAIHALRNPLAAAINSLDLMSHGVTRPEDLPSLRRVTRNGLDRMDALLSHFREVVQLGVDRGAIVDLDALARRVVAGVIPRAEALGVRVTVLPTPTKVTVRGDPESLSDAVDALVINAVDASGDGGGVVVSIANDPTRRDAVVTVQDRGEGIPVERVAGMFRVFVTTRRNHGANGVGLARARWVAAAHGGSVTLVSTVGEGTTATLRLWTGETLSPSTADVTQDDNP